MRNPSFVLGLLLIALALAWIVRDDFIGSAVEEGKRKEQKIEWTDVRVRSYAVGEGRVLHLDGDQVISDSDVTEMDLVPINGVMKEDDEERLWFDAERGKRRTSKAGQVLELEGQVHARATGDRSLASERLLYYPSTGRIHSPGRATLITSRSRLVGDRLETGTDLDDGIVRGNVEIATTHLEGEPASSPSTGSTTASVPVTMNGDTATFDAALGMYEVTGHAIARRERGTLTASRMLYLTDTRFLRATGQVRFTDPDYILTAGVLEYDLKREWMIARVNPQVRILQTSRSAEVNLEAEVLNFDRQTQRLLAEHRVFARVYPDDSPVYEIRSRLAEAFYRAGRSIFKKDVKIRSSEMGADGDRAVFYENSEKVHIIGKARAWSVESDGTSGRILTGNRIIHNSRTGKSIALEKVTLKDRLKEKRPRKTIGLR